MQLVTPFDATTVDPSQGSAQLPIGKHPVIIVASEVKANKANDGGYLELDLQIQDGPNKGQIGAYRLNLYNKSQQAVEIANKQLSALCHVVGVFKVSDSSQLHGVPFVIEVGYQKGEDPATNPQGKGYTEVKRVFDIQGNEPGKKAVTTAPQPAPQPQAQPQQWAAPVAPVAPAAPTAWAAPAPTAPAPQAPSAATPPWQQAPAAPAGNKPPWA